MVYNSSREMTQSGEAKFLRRAAEEFTVRDNQAIAETGQE